MWFWDWNWFRPGEARCFYVTYDCTHRCFYYFAIKNSLCMLEGNLRVMRFDVALRWTPTQSIKCNFTLLDVIETVSTLISPEVFIKWLAFLFLRPLTMFTPQSEPEAFNFWSFSWTWYFRRTQIWSNIFNQIFTKYYTITFKFTLLIY